MPPDRAIEQLVGEPRPRDQHRRAAAELERRALGPLAKLIDRGGRHAHPLGGELYRPGGGKMRSATLPVGKECVRTGISWWQTLHLKQNSRKPTDLSVHSQH